MLCLLNVSSTKCFSDTARKLYCLLKNPSSKVGKLKVHATFSSLNHSSPVSINKGHARRSRHSYTVTVAMCPRYDRHLPKLFAWHAQDCRGRVIVLFRLFMT